MSNPYQVLGVSPSATKDEIKKAYRKLARTLHPDVNPNNKEAADKFKEVTAAYDLLSNDEKRRRFDAGEIDEQGRERAGFNFRPGGNGLFFHHQVIHAADITYFIVNAVFLAVLEIHIVEDHRLAVFFPV